MNSGPGRLTHSARSARGVCTPPASVSQLRAGHTLSLRRIRRAVVRRRAALPYANARRRIIAGHAPSGPHRARPPGDRRLISTKAAVDCVLAADGCRAPSCTLSSVGLGDPQRQSRATLQWCVPDAAKCSGPLVNEGGPWSGRVRESLAPPARMGGRAEIAQLGRALD